MNGVDLLRLILGVLLLFLGRKFFWMFVGIIGFVAGFTLAGNLLKDQPQWLILLIGIVVGVIGAGLAVLLQRVAIALAGFAAGAYLAIALVQNLNLNLGALSWLPWIIGGIIGAILLFVFFDWALIILSSASGAGMIVSALPLTSPLSIIVYIILLVLGILVQAGIRAREHKPEPVTPA